MKQTLKCIRYSCDFLKIQIAYLRRFEFGAQSFNMYTRAQLRLPRIQNHQNKTDQFVKKLVKSTYDSKMIKSL